MNRQYRLATQPSVWWPSMTVMTAGFSGVERRVMLSVPDFVGGSRFSAHQPLKAVVVVVVMWLAGYVIRARTRAVTDDMLLVSL